MAAVFNEVHLTWNGKEYSITPDMRLLNKIEQDISLSELAYRMSMGKVPMSQLAVVIGVMLRKGGANASDEEVYQELMTGDAVGVQDMAATVMEAVFPQPKKSEAARPAAAKK